VPPPPVRGGGTPGASPGRGAADASPLDAAARARAAQAAEAAARPAAPSQLFDQLAQEIRQLQVEFERFFAGGRPLPPEDLRGRIQSRLRDLRNTTFRAAADNFRLADLEARFNSYNELFNRRLRDVEEGRRGGHRTPAEASRLDLERGVVVGETLAPEIVEALYVGLAAGPQDGPRFDLASFETYLARQAAAIRSKTGCTAVQFRITDDDGKKKLKARPIGAPGAS
jgi:hypothetical protein